MSKEIGIGWIKKTGAAEISRTTKKKHQRSEVRDSANWHTRKCRTGGRNTAG